MIAAGVLTAGPCPARAQQATTTAAAAKSPGRPLPPEYYQGRAQPGPLKLTAPTGGGVGSVFARLMGYTVLILVLGGAALVVARKVIPRLSGAATGRNIAVLETVYLGPRKTLHLLRVGRKRFLVAGGKEQLNMLGEVTEAFDGDAGQADGEGADRAGTALASRKGGLFANLLSRKVGDAFAPKGTADAIDQGRSKNDAL